MGFSLRTWRRWFLLSLYIALHLNLLLVSRGQGWSLRPGAATRWPAIFSFLLHSQLHGFSLGHFPATSRLLHGRRTANNGIGRVRPSSATANHSLSKLGLNRCKPLHFPWLLILWRHLGFLVALMLHLLLLIVHALYVLAMEVLGRWRASLRPQDASHSARIVMM